MAPLLLGDGPASVLRITVTGVRNGEGHVRAEVCPREAFLTPNCPWRGEAPAQPGSVTITIEGVPPGTYAVQAYDDENDNHQVDRNFLGIPLEGVGFSNDAPLRLGPPSFDDAAFQLGPEGASITLSLRYFL
jgi:uncharacterized protein (DUF2141 family)